MCIIEREEVKTFYFRYWNKILRKGNDSMNTKKLFPQRRVFFVSNMTLYCQEVAGVALLF